MKYLLFRKMFLVPGMAFVLMLVGCVTDHGIEIDTPPAAKTAETLFTVSVPGMRTPSTRALDAAKEKEVGEIDVVIFDNTERKILEHHRIGASDITDAQGDNDYTFRVRGIEHTEDITAAVVANASAEVSVALDAVKIAGSYVGAAKAAFLLALQVGADNKWNTSADGYWRIPMYGELTVAGSIYNAATQTIRLTRMLAKVDVTNGVAPANPATPADGDFTLTAVHVVNRNTSGLVAPKWDPSTGILETPPATEANLPAGFAPGTVAWSPGNELTYTVGVTQDLLGEIYLFESDALSGNPATPDGVRLVFEGDYTSSGGVTKHYYYPADFTYPRQGGTTDYMPVLRNHRYLFTIAEASGRGYDTMGEAAAAFGVMSNLRTSLVVVDEGDIREMVFNGEYFLGVEAREIFVTREAQEVSIKIATDNPQGWKVKVEDAAANQWLTLVTTAGQIADKTLTFSVSASSDEWAMRIGTIVLTAGRLETRVGVTQGEYRIIAEPANVYPLNSATQHALKVLSNTRWAVRGVDDPNDILLNSATQIAEMIANCSGGNNTSPGDDFNFTLVTATDGSLSGKTFTVTFYDPDGLATDLSVTITAIACGCNGTALALSIGAGGRTYLTHMYGDKCWMVQNSMEGTASAAYFGQGGSISGTDPGSGNAQRYYTYGNAASACPAGWRLPTAAETNTLVDEINADYSGNPNGKAKWWAGSAGATNGAFAGYYNFNLTIWFVWGIAGHWWYDNDGKYFMGNSTGMQMSTNTNYWYSVRCVQDYN